jgi:hypothetical protein
MSKMNMKLVAFLAPFLCQSWKTLKCRFLCRRHGEARTAPLFLIVLFGTMVAEPHHFYADLAPGKILPKNICPFLLKYRN